MDVLLERKGVGARGLGVRSRAGLAFTPSPNEHLQWKSIIFKRTCCIISHANLTAKWQFSSRGHPSRDSDSEGLPWGLDRGDFHGQSASHPGAISQGVRVRIQHSPCLRKLTRNVNEEI